MLGCSDDRGGGQADLILNCVSTAVTDAHLQVHAAIATAFAQVGYTEKKC